MATNLSPKREVPAPVAIPDRLYFKIGDVAQICSLETYVLRFWETQFPQLKPNKSGTGQRLYRRREVELVLEIKRLVHDEGYTLAGARHVLDGSHKRRGATGHSNGDGGASARTVDVGAILRSARAELREIAGMLSTAEPMPMRRRSRLASVAAGTESLFPS